MGEYVAESPFLKVSPRAYYPDYTVYVDNVICLFLHLFITYILFVTITNNRNVGI